MAEPNPGEAGRVGAVLLAAALALGARVAGAQSAADLSARLVVDGRTADFTPQEAVFRDTRLCLTLGLSCTGDEEPDGDSRWSALQDVRQLHVTWDAERHYLGADASLGGHALVLFLDFRPGGLVSAEALPAWRRTLHFPPDLAPDAFLAVRDAAPRPELYLVVGESDLARVDDGDFDAAASFDGPDAFGGLEAAIPWRVLFPDAPAAHDPELGAPAAPVFVLPPESSAHGLRLVAVVVHADDGTSGPDVMPDNSSGMPLDARASASIDRAARVDWDASRAGPPHFVDFGAAVQTQAAPRFLPAPPAPPVALRLDGVRTAVGGRPARLFAADAGEAIDFFLEVAAPVPDALYLTARIYSLRGDRVRELYRDVRRTAASLADPALDRWDGLDAAGRPVPGGMYLLRVEAGLAPGSTVADSGRIVGLVR